MDERSRDAQGDSRGELGGRYLVEERQLAYAALIGAGLLTLLLPFGWQAAWLFVFAVETHRLHRPA